MIFITSNKMPDEWFKNTEDKQPLLRRIDNLWRKDTLHDDFTVLKGAHPAFMLAGFQELLLNEELFAGEPAVDKSCINFENLD